MGLNAGETTMIRSWDLIDSPTSDHRPRLCPPQLMQGQLVDRLFLVSNLLMSDRGVRACLASDSTTPLLVITVPLMGMRAWHI
jgi:hypothetical protein